jgi:hypothetical protein
MGLKFTSASSTSLVSSSVTTNAMPWSVGLWVKPVSLGTFNCFYTMTSSTADRGFELGIAGVNTTLGFWCWTAPTTTGEVDITTAMTAGEWHYILARNISATNRRLSIIKPGGQIVHAQNTTSATVATPLDRHGLGAYASSAPADFSNSIIAEWFFAAADAWPGGGQIPDEMLRVLARNGPWWFPPLLGSVHEYKSLRFGGASRDLTQDDDYALRGNTWTNSATPPVMADHPPGLLMPYDRVIPVVPRTLLV